MAVFRQASVEPSASGPELSALPTGQPRPRTYDWICVLNINVQDDQEWKGYQNHYPILSRETEAECSNISTTGWVVGLSPIVTRKTRDYRLNVLRKGSFWGILTRIYTSFVENHVKLRSTRLTSATGNRTQHLRSTSFQRITAGSWRHISNRNNEKYVSRRSNNVTIGQKIVNEL